MAPKFTPINGIASTSGAAIARAGAQSQGPETSGLVNRAGRAQRNVDRAGRAQRNVDRPVETQRRSPTAADPEIMEKYVRKLKLEREHQGEDFRWPTGLTAGNAVVARIERSGVPKALSSEGEHRDPATLDFVLCAKQNSNWVHSKTAACIGRSEVATRLILYHARIEERKRQLATQATAHTTDGETADEAAAKALQRVTELAAARETAEQAAARVVERAAERVAAQNAVPSPTPPFSVGQVDRPEPIHPPTQTSFEAQCWVASGGEFSKYALVDRSGFSQYSDQVRSAAAGYRPGSDLQTMSGLDALAAAAAIRAREAEKQLPPIDSARQVLSLPSLEAMGLK